MQQQPGPATSPPARQYRSRVSTEMTPYDAKFFNIKMPEGTKMTVQDPAYTSLIWYTPSK